MFYLLLSILNVPSIRSAVIPVGVYYGKRKPLKAENFLKPFKNEAIRLINGGINVNGKDITVTIKGFCCDAPAKSFILGIKGHTGYSSCTKCKEEGSFFNNRMTFPNCYGIPRTHEGFLRREDPDFHTAETILVEIPGVHFAFNKPLV